MLLHLNFYSQENLIKYTEGFFNKFTIDLDKLEAKLSKREADYLLTNIIPKEFEKLDQMISNLVKNPKKWDKKIINAYKPKNNHQFSSWNIVAKKK